MLLHSMYAVAQHIPICRMGVEYCSPFLLASHPVLSADLLFCCSCRHLLSVWDSCDTHQLVGCRVVCTLYSAIRYLFYSTTCTLYPLWDSLWSLWVVPSPEDVVLGLGTLRGSIYTRARARRRVHGWFPRPQIPGFTSFHPRDPGG